MITSQEFKDDLDQYIKKLMVGTRLPGLSVGVLQGEDVFTAGYGITSSANPLPVTDDTLFQIGSITKTFTGIAVMQLVEAGKLDLDAKVRKYIPHFRVADEAASAEVTVRNLMTHTCGWEGDIFVDTGSGEDALAQYVESMSDLEQVNPVGSVVSYCNSAFSVLGYLIEKLTGQPYQTVMKERVLGPLGLENALYEPGDVMTHRFAVGHDTPPSGAEVLRPWSLTHSLYPVGGLVCHVKDLLRYARFLLGDGTTQGGTRLLSAESLEMMQLPQVPIWEDWSIGLPWFIRILDGVRTVAHSGATFGQQAYLQFVPARNFALAVLTNADCGGGVWLQISRKLLKDCLDITMPVPEKIEASLEELAAYAGSYSRPAAEIELGMVGDRLILTFKNKVGFPTHDCPVSPPGPPMSVGLCERDRLLVLDGPSKGDRLEVVRKPDGSIGWLRAGLRLYARLD